MPRLPTFGRLRPSLVLALAAILCPLAGLSREASPLRTAAAVHQLKAEAADQGLPVELEGVVTHFHRRLGDGFFLQDESDGIYIRIFGKELDIERGDLVRVTGRSGPGGFAPIVELETLEHLDSRPLPAPEKVRAADLATGRFDSRHVEIRGVVRSASVAPRVRGNREETPHLALEVYTDGHYITVGINDYEASSLNLVAAEIVVRGIAAGVFSHRRQLLSPVVVVESDADLEVLEWPRPLDELPVHTIAELFRYSAVGIVGQRTRIQGQLLGGPANRWLAVRDATSALFVDVNTPLDLQPGDHVELFGFPESREHALWLMNATVRRLRRGEPPVPKLGGVMDGLQNPCDLWTIEGLLTAPPRPGDEGWLLNLEGEDGVFEAWVPAIGEPHNDDWVEGARLAVTGVSQPFFLPGHRQQMIPFPRALRIHARGLADLEILATGPWWNKPGLARSMTYALAVAVVMLAMVAVLALLLARNNKALVLARNKLDAAQTQLAQRFSIRTGEWQQELAARHAAEADFALLTAERTRLARELHDTIEQSIASTALHLDAATGLFPTQPEKSVDLLKEATRQLRESQSEVRRSVWNLRSIKLENTTLPDALEQLALALSDTQGPAVSFTCEGTPFELPSGTASHLFRIAQEGVTNALKHAEAMLIALRLRFDESGVELSIQDNGHGFEASQKVAQGHFGLRGMQERASALGTEIQIESKPSGGTTLTVRLPREHLHRKANHGSL